jgi:uncharacterized protein
VIAMTEPSSVNPWYKEPWPWMILGLLGLGIVAGTSIAFIGITNPPEMVTGEYERLGRGLTDTATRTGQARNLGLFGQVGLEGDRVVLEINAHDPAALPASLLIRFQHPATSDGDSSVVLEREAHGRYIGHLTIAPHERSQVIVTDLAQTWWLSGRRSDANSPIAVEPKRL